MSGPDYNLTSLWISNIDKVRDNPTSRREYVANWAERTGTSFEVAWHWFCTDDMAAAHFSKDPRRQNSHEKIASEWIKNIPGICNFKKLDNKGPKAWYVSNGLPMHHSALANNDAPKSVDFYWELFLPCTNKHLVFYATHKHTFEDGGSQDNQLEDLKQFTLEASKLQKDMGHRFLSLADGPYYQKIREGGGCHMDELKAMLSRTTYARAMTCSELPSYMIDCIQDMAKTEPNATQDPMKTDIANLIVELNLYV